VKLLVDEDTLSGALISRLLAAGHAVLQLPEGSSDEEVFTEAQHLAIPILTANVGRKGRRDPIGLYKLARERIPHHGVIGIFRSAPTRKLPDQQIVEAINRLASQERQ
jgi:hypothetical protein